MEREKSLDLLVEQCLGKLGISSLGQWDVLVFLYRHHLILATTEHIARLLGYPCEVVGEALDTLQSLGLVRGSRTTQDVHLYQLAPSEAPSPTCFGELMTLAEDRTGRLLLAKKLAVRICTQK